MQKFVYHLVGIEDDLLGYLGLSPKGLKPQDDPDNDEEFDEWKPVANIIYKFSILMDPTSSPNDVNTS